MEINELGTLLIFKILMMDYHFTLSHAPETSKLTRATCLYNLCSSSIVSMTFLAAISVDLFFLKAYWFYPSSFVFLVLPEKFFLFFHKPLGLRKNFVVSPLHRLWDFSKIITENVLFQYASSRSGGGVILFLGDITDNNDLVRRWTLAFLVLYHLPWIS